MSVVPDLPDLFAPFGSRLVLAKVTGYDYLVEDTGLQSEDDFGNPIPTGLLTIELLDRSGSREKVPFVIPMAGNTVFNGGLPERGTLCVVGWRQQDNPVIIGFLPPGLGNVIKSRRTVPNILPGEVFFQSSSEDTDVDGDVNFFSTAKLYLDRYGRINISCQDYSLVIGYLLSNEFMANVSVVNDPITGNPVFLQEKIVGGVEKRVDNAGNVVHITKNNRYYRVGGSILTQVTGSIDQLAAKGQKFYDDRGNMLQIAEDGTVNIVAATAAMNLTSIGTATESVGGDKVLQAMQNISQVSGQDFITKVGGKSDTTIAEGETRSVILGDSVEQIIAGQKEILSLLGISLAVLTPGVPIKLGSLVAPFHVALAEQTMLMFQAIVDLLSTPFTVLTTPAGMTAIPNPALLATMEAALLTNVTNPATNLLAGKVMAAKF